MIALENCLAETFERLSLLDASVVLAYHSITSGHLLLTLSDRLCESFDSLANRVLHYFTYLVAERVQTLFTFTQSRRIVLVFPLIYIFLDLLLKFLRLFSFEFGFKLRFFVTEVHGLLNRNLVFLEAIEEVLIDFELLIGVGLSPLLWRLRAVLGLYFLLCLAIFTLTFNIRGLIFGLLFILPLIIAFRFVPTFYYDNVFKLP